jgi:hypothetical protein
MLRRLHRRTIEWRRLAQYEPVRVDGVESNNEDGSNRQQLLSRCDTGMPVVLRREQRKPGDPNAVALFLHGGPQIGYLTPSVAAWVAPLLDADQAAFDAEIWSLDRIAAADGRTLIGCTIGLRQFGFVFVERFSWSLAITAAGRLPAVAIKWTARHIAPVLRSSAKRP